MIEPLRGVVQGCRQIFHLQVRHLVKDLLRGETGRKKIKDVYNPDPHTANGWTATALFGVDGYSLVRISHRSLLMFNQSCERIIAKFRATCTGSSTVRFKVATTHMMCDNWQ